MQRGGDDVATRTGQVTGAVVVDGQVETVVAQERGQPVGRALAVGRDHHTVALGEELVQAQHESCAVAHDRTPPRRLDQRRVR